MNSHAKTFYIRIQDNDPKFIEKDELMEQICDDIQEIKNLNESILQSLLTVCRDIYLINSKINPADDSIPPFKEL